MLSVGITVKQMSNKQNLGDLQPFGDIVTFDDLDKAARYYRVNSYQRKQLFTLFESHLPTFCEYWDVNLSDYRLMFVVTRLGFTKVASLLCVASNIIYPDKNEVRMRIIETRFIRIGKKGGLELINAARRGTKPHGLGGVLKAEPENTLWGKRIRWDVSGAESGSFGQ